MNIFVIGCGRWGSLITWYLDRIGHRVTLYGRKSSPKMQAFLAEQHSTPLKAGCRLIDLLRRPELRYAALAAFDPDRPDLPAAVREQVEIRVKYEGYIARQEKDVEQFRRLESRVLPAGLDYDAVPSLRLEARQKLKDIRPLNFGQAGRISGVSPADLTALMIYLNLEKA